MIGTVVVDPLQDKNVGSYLSSHIFLMVKINKSNTTGATSGTETAHSSDLNSHPLLVGSFCLIFDFPCNILATIVLCFRPFSFGQFIVCPSVYGSDYPIDIFKGFFKVHSSTGKSLAILYIHVLLFVNLFLPWV